MKYAPSALIGRLSRSAGSTTASHNRYGAYLRNRVIPTNPATAKQTDVRTNLATQSSRWRTLSDVQRAAWGAWAPNLTRTDTLGQTYELNGQTAFLSVQRNINTYGGTPSSTPPAYTPPAGLASATVSASEGPSTISIAFTATPLAANTKLAIFATRPLSAGINFQPNGAYKLIQVTTAAKASPADISSDYVAIFGDIAADQKILFKIVVLNVDGLASATLQTSAIVV